MSYDANLTADLGGTEPIRISRLPRWTHHFLAWARGYFWLPCPTCGRPFGGHEWRDIDGKPSWIDEPDAPNLSAICPACTRAGRGDGHQ